MESWEESSMPLDNQSPSVGGKNYIQVSSPLVALEAKSRTTKLRFDTQKFLDIKTKIRNGHKHLRLVDTGIADGAELEVTPFQIFTKDAVIESDLGTKLALPDIVSMHGKVAGDLDSFVSLHIGAHGAYGTVQSNKRTWQVTTPEDRSSHSVLVELMVGDEGDEISKQESIDSEISAPVNYSPKKKVVSSIKPAILVDNFDATGTNPVLTVAAECDKKCRDLFQTSGSCETSSLVEVSPVDDFEEMPGRQLLGRWPTRQPTPPPTNSPTNAPAPPTPTGTSTSSSTAGCDHPAATYLASVIGGTSSIYSRDLGVSLQIKYMKVWSGASPYDDGTASLTPFQQAYSSVANTIKDADIAHLFTGKVEGGLAYVSTACDNRGYNTGVSSIRGTWKNTLDPSAYNWDLIVTSHELGHNVGSGHTHSAYSPPVDQCVDSNGNAAARGSSACVRGTIMSYCHLCGGVANIDMKFAAEVISKIKNNLRTGRCQLSSLS